MIQGNLINSNCRKNNWASWNGKATGNLFLLPLSLCFCLCPFVCLSVSLCLLLSLSAPVSCFSVSQLALFTYQDLGDQGYSQDGSLILRVYFSDSPH